MINRRKSVNSILLALAMTALAACSDSSDISVEREDSGRPKEEDQSQAISRYEDGLVRFDRMPGEFGGYWADASAVSLVEDGVDVAMNEKGILLNPDDADKVAPFMPWSLALYKFRQQMNLRSDPVNICISPAGPRHHMDPRGFRIVQDRNYDRIYILFGGGNMNWRVIWMDGREMPRPEDVTGTFFGNSSGHWDGDTLVVESDGFSERFWFSNGGQPHSNDLRLTETFTRTDYETLTYAVTIEDPQVYTRPWTSSWTLNWQKGQEIEEDFCEDHK